MRRRMLLHAAALGGAGLVAGCTGEPAPGTGDGTGTGTDSPTESPTDSPTEPATDSSTPRESEFERSFTVTSVDCGTGEDRAEITVDGDAVVVDGIASAADPCRTARLVADETGLSDGTLHVAVETYVPPENEDEVCAQCLADVDYEATFTFDDGLPERVTVSHDGTVVAETDL